MRNVAVKSYMYILNTTTICSMVHCMRIHEATTILDKKTTSKVNSTLMNIMKMTMLTAAVIMT